MATGESSSLCQYALVQTSSARQRQEDLQEEEDKNTAFSKLNQIQKMSQLVDLSYEVIEENWLNNVDDLPANMFCLAAFGLLPIQVMNRAIKEDDDKAKKYKTFMPKWQKAYIGVFGFIVICCIQILGPPAIFLSTVFAWGVPPGHEMQWSSWEIDDTDWHHVALTKLLSIFGILGFILNGITVILDERRTWKHIDRIFTHFNTESNSDLHGEHMLYLGATINCWVVLWCCLDTLVVLGPAESPRDVIFDCLGLIFLFNLDDIGGDLGFLAEDDWPGLRLAWIHDKIKKNYEEEVKFDIWSRLTLYAYKGTLILLYIMAVALPVIAALTSFSKIAPPT